MTLSIPGRRPARSGAARLLLLLPALLPLLLAGCGAGDWFFGSTRAKTLKGDRVSVLDLESKLEPDPQLASLQVALPSPVVNPDWSQSAGDANHVMGHPALPDQLSRAWTADIGYGTSRTTYQMASPVVVGDVVFTLDARADVSAFRAKDGKQLWSVDLTPRNQVGRAFGGGIAAADGTIYVTTGYAQLVALEAATGRELWRQTLEAPVHGAPTLAGGKIFVVTVDDQLLALNGADGSKLWSYAGIPEPAGVLGSVSPAVEGDVVVAPFSSGEVVALRVENGRVLWTDNLASTRRFDAVSSLADIRGQPVIDRGRVLAISHSGRLVSIDLRTGDRAWEQEIGGVYTPWVAGDFIYVLSSDQQLICLTRLDGRIRWMTPIARYENMEKKRGALRWAGPILAGDRLVVVGSNGEALSFSPYTGQALGKVELPEGSFLPPIVAGNSLYVTTDDADLIALR